MERRRVRAHRRHPLRTQTRTPRTHPPTDPSLSAPPAPLSPQENVRSTQKHTTLQHLQPAAASKRGRAVTQREPRRVVGRRTTLRMYAPPLRTRLCASCRCRCWSRCVPRTSKAPRPLPTISHVASLMIASTEFCSEAQRRWSSVGTSDSGGASCVPRRTHVPVPLRRRVGRGISEDVRSAKRRFTEHFREAGGGRQRLRRKRRAGR